MYNEHSQEGHLFAGVLEYDTGVVRLAPKAIRSHYHSKVVHVHFSDCNVCRLSKNLRKTWEMHQSSAISRKTSLCICCLLCVCLLSVVNRGAVKGGKVRTILRAHDGEGAPRGRNVISTEGNARALHFSPTPTGLRSGQFSRHNSDF